MANLSADNLGKSFDLGGPLSAGPSAPISERRVTQEMTRQGMEVPSAEASKNATSFSDLLRQSVDQVNQDQAQADMAVKELVAGRSKNLHETMLTIERADVSLRLMMQVRNKIIDAYKEIMKMQV